MRKGEVLAVVAVVATVVISLGLAALYAIALVKYIWG